MRKQEVYKFIDMLKNVEYIGIYKTCCIEVVIKKRKIKYEEFTDKIYINYPLKEYCILDTTKILNYEKYENTLQVVLK